MKMISLRRLFSNYFEGHAGRPGLRGGSKPRSGGGASLRREPKLPSDRGYKATDTSIEDAMKGFDRTPASARVRGKGGSPEGMEAEYKKYKKMPMKDLRVEYKKVTKRSDVSGDKETLIEGIFLDKYGADKINAWVDEYGDE